MRRSLRDIDIAIRKRWSEYREYAMAGENTLAHYRYKRVDELLDERLKNMAPHGARL